MPSPVVAETGVTSISASGVAARRACSWPLTSTTRSRGTRSILLTTGNAAADAQEIHDVQMFDRLRHDAVVCRHDDEHAVDPADAS